jgi:RimJ/RimL family protein N-acetyltransferase
VNGHCLAIRRRDGNQLGGTTALLVPNPEDDTPWLGLLMISGRHQGQGLGREGLGACEEQVAADG